MMIVNTLMVGEAGYPEVLTNLHRPPKQLFWQGSDLLNWMAMPKVAVVGTRRVTAYGRQVTEKLVKELVEYGIVIISGLALGIDGIAHQACLAAGGITAAILPTPIQKIAPTSHYFLAQQILKNGGTLISEYSADSVINQGNFIARNRIVSGLCDVLLITEASLKSGTMHTARFALEQGKTVMVVPGNITSEVSQGCNNLIKAGALPVTEVEDILFALNINPKQHKQVVKFGSHQEEVIYMLLKVAPRSVDEISLLSQLSAQEITSCLTMLEIQGQAKPLGNGLWTIS